MAISSNATGLRPGVCTSTTRPTTPYTGQLIFQTDTGTMHNWDGAAWQFLAPTQQRNLLYNGAMQVAQRGTSKAGVGGSSSEYATADRYRMLMLDSGARFTQSVAAEAPTGQGFTNSLKMACTTAVASPGATTLLTLEQVLEGQDLQSLRKGTANAKELTFSFWVRSFQTGTYVVELYDETNNRSCSKSYTVNASATWEFKTITFPADTTGTIANNNAAALRVSFYLYAGSTFQSGSLQTTWGTLTNGNRAVGQVNVGSSTSNYWQVTGLMLNEGPVAAPFQFKSYGQELRECQRYYCRFDNGGAYAQLFNGHATSTSNVRVQIDFPVRMRDVPSTTLSTSANNTFRIVDGVNAANPTGIAMAAASRGYQTAGVDFSAGAVFTQYRPYWIDTDNQTAGSGFVAFSAEL